MVERMCCGFIICIATALNHIFSQLHNTKNCVTPCSIQSVCHWNGWENVLWIHIATALTHIFYLELSHSLYVQYALHVLVLLCMCRIASLPVQCAICLVFMSMCMCRITFLCNMPFMQLPANPIGSQLCWTRQIIISRKPNNTSRRRSASSVTDVFLISQLITSRYWTNIGPWGA